MKKPISVLLIEDSEEEATRFLRELQRIGYEPVIQRVQNADQFSDIIIAQPWDVILSDYELHRFSAEDALCIMKEQLIDLPFVVISKPVGEEKVAAILKAGAHDFLVKGKLGRLAKVIEDEINATRARQEKEWAIQLIILAKQEWEATFDALASLLLFITDTEGNIIRLNEAAIRFFEADYLEILGTQIENLIFENIEIGAEDYQLRGDIKFRNSDHWFNISSFPIFLGEREYGTAYLLRDITTRKEIESARIKLQSLVGFGTLVAGIMAREVNKYAEAAQQQVQELLQQTQNRGSSPDKNHRDIQQNIAGILDITHRLERYSLTHQNTLEIFNLNDLVNDTLLLFESQIKQTGEIRIRTQLKPELPSIGVDQHMIVQAIANILLNARDAMPAGGEIFISTDYDRERHMLLLHISDTGLGIPENMRNTIFEPFYTTRDSSAETEINLGLGLALVADIVRSHGGDVIAHSDSLQGATITIQIPEQSLKQFIIQQAQQP